MSGDLNASTIVAVARAVADELERRKGYVATPPRRAADLPAWVAEFLDRRTAVEHILRTPMNIRKRNARGLGKPLPEPAPLTAEEMWDLANELSVPAEFGTQASATQRERAVGTGPQAVGVARARGRE